MTDMGSYFRSEVKITPLAAATLRVLYIEEAADAVERMASLVSWLTNNTTIEMVSGIHSLPTIPSNYQGVIRTIHSPNSSIQEIGEAVNKDMGMTSRVIQVANSAFYGYSKRITN